MLRSKAAALVLAAGILLPAPAGAMSIARHERERRRCYNSSAECRGDQDYDNGRDDNRRAGISPGPFDRSPVDIHDNNLTVCFPFSTCGKKDGEQDPSQPMQPKEPITCIIQFPYHCDKRPKGMITDPRKLAQFPVTVVQMSLEFAQKILQLVV